MELLVVIIHRDVGRRANHILFPWNERLKSLISVRLMERNVIVSRQISGVVLNVLMHSAEGCVECGFVDGAAHQLLERDVYRDVPIHGLALAVVLGPDGVLRVGDLANSLAVAVDSPHLGDFFVYILISLVPEVKRRTQGKQQDVQRVHPEDGCRFSKAKISTYGISRSDERIR